MKNMNTKIFVLTMIICNFLNISAGESISFTFTPVQDIYPSNPTQATLHGTTITNQDDSISYTDVTVNYSSGNSTYTDVKDIRAYSNNEPTYPGYTKIGVYNVSKYKNVNGVRTNFLLAKN